jgi:hypothetical protein
MPKFIECFQHDEFGVPTREWMAARCGRITASRLGDVMAYSTQKGKEGKELKVRADYRSELAAERMTGMNARHFVTPEMKWGQEQEDYARSMYEVERGVMVDQIGFAIHPTTGLSVLSAAWISSASQPRGTFRSTNQCRFHKRFTISCSGTWSAANFLCGMCAFMIPA